MDRAGHGLLTHWPLRDVNKILDKYFQVNFSDGWLRYRLCNWSYELY